MVQEQEVKIQGLEIWLLIRKVMTHELWVKDKVHCLAVLLMVDSDFREKSASSETCSVSPCFRNDSTVVLANLTLSLYGDPSLEFAQGCIFFPKIEFFL